MIADDVIEGKQLWSEGGYKVLRLAGILMDSMSPKYTCWRCAVCSWCQEPRRTHP